MLPTKKAVQVLKAWSERKDRLGSRPRAVASAVFHRLWPGAAALCVSCMNKNAVICGIEHALRDEGCNEVPVGELYTRLRKTRGNFKLSLQDFVAVVEELLSDGLFETFGESPELSEASLIARSQLHPSVPYGEAIQL